MWLKITKNYSPNFSLPKRSRKKIKFIIIHYTGMKKESAAIKRLCAENTKVSAHYFIKKNGEIINLIPDLYEAWHAGQSSWKKFISLNKNSIGIEIQNQGHEYRYEKFTLKQISSLKRLLKELIKSYKINLANVLGHSDIAPERKKDPGEKFPWKYLSKNRVGLWPTVKKKELLKNRAIKTTNIDKELFFNNLFKIGYSKNMSKKNYLNCLTKAFQRRFRQELIDGKIDRECVLISQNLSKQS